MKFIKMHAKINLSFILLILISFSSQGCTFKKASNKDHSNTPQSPIQAPNSPSPSPLAPEDPRLVSYNGVIDTFQRTHIDSLIESGLTGQGIVIRFQDEGPVDLAHALLAHTLIPGTAVPVPGGNAHATWMALIATGALNPNIHQSPASGLAQQIGVAPEALIAGDLNDWNHAVIVNDSINGQNLIRACDYRMPAGGFVGPADLREINPPQAQPRSICVAIAGNGGSGRDTGHAWHINDGHVPIWGNIIVTVAVDHLNRITPTSQRCGNTHRFCIGVPSNGTTSETAPIVSGALALLMQAFPRRPLSQYVQAILETATPLAQSRETGRGLLNAEAAYDFLRTHP
jgi:hypothetical protein